MATSLPDCTLARALLSVTCLCALEEELSSQFSWRKLCAKTQILQTLIQKSQWLSLVVKPRSIQWGHLPPFASHPFDNWFQISSCNRSARRRKIGVGIAFGKIVALHQKIVLLNDQQAQVTPLCLLSEEFKAQSLVVSVFLTSRCQLTIHKLCQCSWKNWSHWSVSD